MKISCPNDITDIDSIYLYKCYLYKCIYFDALRHNVELLKPNALASWTKRMVSDWWGLGHFRTKNDQPSHLRLWTFLRKSSWTVQGLSPVLPVLMMEIVCVFWASFCGQNEWSATTPRIIPLPGRALADLSAYRNIVVRVSYTSV